MLLGWCLSCPIPSCPIPSPPEVALGTGIHATATLSPADPPRDPQLTAFLETQRGRLAIFEGSVASNPPAQLALYRGEELVASSGTGHGTNPRVSATATPNALRVEIRDVTLADEGTYSLTATNAHGTVSQHLDFRVQGEQGCVARALGPVLVGGKRRGAGL